MKLASEGIEAALRSDKDIHEGVNTYQGKLTCKAIADSQDMSWTALADLV